MSLLIQTPDILLSVIELSDILLSVIELSDIDTVLALRLTSRGIHNLISLYESTISQAVAKVSFPDAGLLLRPPSNGKFNIKWLISLIPKQLAAIAVENGYSNMSPRFPHVIGAEFPQGDPVRERVDRGWRILQRLSLIARDIDTMSDAHPFLSKHNRKWSLPPFTRRKKKLEMTTRRERLVTQMRLEYINTLESSAILDYKIMRSYVHWSYHNIYFDLRYIAWQPRISQRRGFSWSRLVKFEQRKGERMMEWMEWFLLREGPALFWDQWWRRERTASVDEEASGFSALKFMLQAHHSRSKEQIKIETEAASCITSSFGSSFGDSGPY